MQFQRGTTRVEAVSSAKAKLPPVLANRIDNLLEIGGSEGIVHSESSLLELIAFLLEEPSPRQPSLFLLDNGNFRCVWRDRNGEQLGLQFRGNGIAQWVAFARAGDEELTSSGSVPIANVGSLVQSLGLGQILHA